MSVSVNHPIRDRLGPIWQRNRIPLAVTYGLSAGENVCELLYPAAIGLAINTLLRGDHTGLTPLALLWFGHLSLGLFRHVYDTKVFTGIYQTVATQSVAEQRANGGEGLRISGRVALSRELVSFFETEFPATAKAAVRFFGSVTMLFVYDVVLGLCAVAATLSITIANRWFAGRAYRLNRALNERLEREPGIIAEAPLPRVHRHFGRVRFWRIAISTAEAKTWGMVEFAVIGLALATLILITGRGGVSAGEIYAVLAYVDTFGNAVDDLPHIVQNSARVRDIAERLSVDLRATIAPAPAPQG